jgi:hypothetical protein
VLTRRAFLHSFVVASVAQRAHADTPLRHRRVGDGAVIEVRATRVWVDADTGAAAPANIGDVDVVCVCAAARRMKSLAAAVANDARVLVPDESTARRARHAGFLAVRVVAAGDVVAVGDVVITASPARGALGFHVQSAGHAVWVTGPIAPLDVDAGPAAFAKDHRAAVVISAAGASDVDVLAALAR